MVVLRVHSGTTVHALCVPVQLMQVWSNYRQGHTGQLSLITTALLFLGGLARIFTSLTETGDPLIVVTFCLATLANSLIFGQVLYYWEATNKLVKKKAK
ncbi:hypothetical protein HPB49_002397 [Dermacentor silvarum]|uniref:Uncharacterized protein n=1 Tax=Dermacentor silvarum TaxID=543639 RepID=A0ACB8DA09_DERSI|nr:hypothetical protein HPB49_002397 [Dermacentor silvarum]